MPDELVKRILKVVGNLRNFTRTVSRKGKLLTFCIFEFDSGEDILRASKFLNGIRIIDKTLQLKTSDQTHNFLNEWMTIQREEWKKKLMGIFQVKKASGMNQAKQFSSLEKYLERDDKRIAEQLQTTVATVNVKSKLIQSELRKIIHEKMREDQRKEHPKEKERDKRKRQFKEDLDRKYNQKMEGWLNREKDKQREYRKERQRERDRERAKLKRLERQLQLEPDEQARRISKFLTNERRKQREKELVADAEKQLEWKPPEPAIMDEVLEPQQPAPDDVQVDEQVKQANKRIQYSVIEEELRLREDDMKPEEPEQPVLSLQAAKHHAKPSSASKPEGLFIPQEQPVETKKKHYQLNLPKVSAESELTKQQQEELQKKQLELFRQVPQTRQELWTYPIDWQLLSKSVIIERKIRPWLHKKSIEYMGEVEDNFISVIEIQLIKSSSPDKIVKILKELLEEDAEDFVIKLWKVLIFELIKLKNGIIP